jgi:ATP:ADP antiporter, AAA family
MEEDQKPAWRFLLPIQKGEWLASVTAFVWFFLIMLSYQLLRPLRDSLVGELPSQEKSVLFFATFVAMVVAVPLYAQLVSLLNRRSLVLVLITFFALNLVGFAFWNSSGGGVWLIRVFFVWVSVFSLYVTSLFWSVLTDLFSNDKGKRLFGPIASGGTTGAIAGSSLAMYAQQIGSTRMLIVAAVVLQLGIVCALSLERATRSWPNQARREPLSGGILEGLRGIFASRYLLQVSLYIALISYFGTTFYMQLTEIAAREIPDREVRAAFFAGLNLKVQLGTLIAQFFIVGPVMRRCGLSTALMILPAVAGVCFLIMANSTSLAVFGLIDVVSRIVTYGFAVPAREVLFTVVNREAKYKSKNVVDTIVIRGADTIASSAFAQLKGFLSLPTINWLLLPVAVYWLYVAFRLGRSHSQLANEAARNPADV